MHSDGPNRIWIYKNNINDGIPNFGWIYYIDTATANAQIVNKVYGNITSVPAAEIHFYSNSGVHYRCYRSTTVSKITRLNQGEIDYDCYLENPSLGEVLIQNINSQDLFYPYLVGNNLYVFNRGMNQFSAWSIVTSNTQTITPITIDTRVNRYGGLYRPVYPRLHFDSSTNLLHDTRTYFSWDTMAFAQKTAQYPLCPSNNYSLINKTDRQPVRLLSSGLSYYDSDLYKLNNNLYCPILESPSRKQQSIVDGAITLPFTALENHVGEAQLPALNFAQPIYEDSSFTIGADVTGTSLLVNGAARTLPANYINFCKIEYEAKYYIRTTTDFRIFTGTTEQVISATSLSGAQRYCFIWNRKLFIITDAEVSALNVDTLAVEYFSVAFSRPNQVRLFVDNFNNQLLLYDRASPDKLRKLDFPPANFDFTNVSVASVYSSEYENIFDSVLPKTLPTVEWTIYQPTPEHIIYVDYQNGQYEVVYRYKQVINSGSITARPGREKNPTQTQVGNYIFDKNLLSIIKLFSNQTAQLISQQAFILESVGVAPQNTALVVSPDSRIVVNTQQSTGYLQWLVPGAGTLGGANANSYKFIFNRSFPRVAPVALQVGTLRLNYYSNIKGEALDSFDIEQLEIEDYKANLVDLPKTQLKSLVQVEGAQETFHEISITAVVDSTKLNKLLKLYYNQFRDSTEDHKWQILLDDNIYQQSSANYRASNGTATEPSLKYVTYDVAVVSVDWNWHSDEKYRITINLMEVTR